MDGWSTYFYVTVVLLRDPLLACYMWRHIVPARLTIQCKSFLAWQILIINGLYVSLSPSLPYVTPRSLPPSSLSLFTSTVNTTTTYLLPPIYYDLSTLDYLDYLLYCCTFLH